MSFAELDDRAREIVARYEYPKAAMLPLLWLVQQTHGYITPEAEEWVGSVIDIAPAHVHEVVTFYNMYHRAPVGRRELRVCTSLPCMLRGGLELLEHIEQELGIKPGETTADGKVTLTEVECLCACEMSPMAQLE